MRTEVTTLLCLASLVSLAGGFAPSIEAPFPPVTAAPPTTTTTAFTHLQPTFLGRHNATVTVHAGDTATLACHVLQLGDKTVSWLRRQGGALHLLTVGFQTYHNDNRYSLRYEQPNNWKLQIRFAQKEDEGLYQCQVSSHPNRILPVYLSVSVPTIEIRDPRGKAVSEAFYRVDSMVGLQCVVTPAPPSRPVMWSKEGRLITTQRERSIRVDTSQMGAGLSSWLHIAHASLTDNGNYTCSAGDSVQAFVRVHVLDGESSAAMHHSNTGGATALAATPPLALLLLLLATLPHLTLH